MFSHIKEFFTRPSGYTISRSVRLRSSASAYFNRTLGSGNRKTWTWSCWTKLGTGNYQIFFQYGTAGNNRANLEIASTGEITYLDTLSGVTQALITTSAVYRDPSAWYHIILAWDTTQSTASNRVKLYINGLQVTSFSAQTNPSLNYDGLWNQAVASTIGVSSYNNTIGLFNGYLTEINFIDGQALTPSSFGSTNAITGVWQPAKYTGTYGTNGFYLNFSDNSNNTATTIGKDYSGNGNNWTPNNISVTAGATYDSMIDTPTPYADGGNGRGNYCVFNPLDKNTNLVISDGNLKVTASASTFMGRATFGMTSGKWYWEVYIAGSGGGIGIATGQATLGNILGGDANGWAYDGSGLKYNNGSGTSYGATWTVGDTVGFAFDADAGTITCYKNNTSQGVMYSSLTSGPYFPATSANTSTNYAFNFGQRPFTYTPPTGFVALNTYNLPDSTIKNGAIHMSAVLYTGDGNTNRNITGVGFQTDFNWTKSRSSASYSHQLADSVRGWSKYLYSNATNAEGTDATNHIQSVNSDGYVINSGASFNASGVTYVAWDWKAGNSAGSSNTSGSITSTVSVNATAGFSVVTYTATNAAGTIGHGLGVAPSLIITKNRSDARNWGVYHASVGATKFLQLNSTGASQTGTAWNDTAPTSTVFSVGGGSYGETNYPSGSSYVAYCWAAVKGFSAFGSYTGNGSADGPFIYTGFRPRFVLVKNSSAIGKWVMMDTSRGLYNEMTGTNALYPNLSDAEGTDSANRQMDFLSNGFKLRCTGGDANGSGNTIIYMAFAENPFRNALAR